MSVSGAVSPPAGARRDAYTRRLRVRPRRARLRPEAWWVWAAVVVFLVGSTWWLTQDDRVPDYDSGFHMLQAMSYHNAMAAGQPFAWFTDYDTYPPLVHLLGAFSIFLFGPHVMTLIMTSNVIFVPLLAFGCYGTGRFVAGPRAGLLAGLFGLATPMFVSMMHEYDMDPPQTAMVAMTVWTILESRRFSRPGVSAVAGLMCALALMCKETTVVFVAGLLIVVVIRGGWRNWRGLGLFALITAIIAGPWYVDHLTALLSTYTHIGQLAPNALQAPGRFTVDNALWYAWNLINQQVLFIFTVLMAIGIILAIRQSLRNRRDPGSVLPELLAGLLVSWAGMTYLTHKDPRYTLPALVYVVVLGTYWIPGIARAALRRALSVGVIALAVVYFAGMTVGIGNVVRIPLPGSQVNILWRNQLTLYQTIGWVRGGPVTDAQVLALMKWLHRLGVLRVQLYTGPDELDFNVIGIEAVAATTDVYAYITPWPPSPQNVFVFVHQPRPGDPPPCQRLNDGLGIYVAAGNSVGLQPATLRNPASPGEAFTFICPSRAPLVYHSPGSTQS